MESRYQWFINRIEKTVFRTKVECPCITCKAGYRNGVFISDKDHAIYLYDIESEMNIKYFDSEEERNEFENN